ncbi:MAG: GNAT family N-acetyltransferase [Candidatus Binatia bacterium]
MATSIGEARPDHAGFIAWVTLTAWRSHLARGFWDFFIDGNEAECLRFLDILTTTDTPHWVHYSTFMVAEIEGTPVAALSGYFDAELGLPSLRKGIAEADGRLGRTRDQTAAGLRRVAPILLVAPDHQPGVWIVENVATRPDCRRRGLVDALLSAICDRGRQRGATQTDIGVMIGNEPARRAYEKAGFRVTGEKRHPDFEAVWGSPGILALGRAL